MSAANDPTPAEDQRLWDRRAWCLVAGLLLFRLIYAAIVPLDLVPDEAYYWDWSRQLDWGYYSKPPMVAWLIASSTRLLGSSPFTVRLPAVLLSSIGLLLVYACGKRMFGPATGFWAVVLSAAAPGSVAVGLLMTIDAPLLFCWMATLYAFWRAVEGERLNARWLAICSLTAGLGLLSKQTMLGFFPLAGMFLLASPTDRPKLLKPSLWLAGLAALLFLAPVIWWNAHHDWITWQHTQHHFAGRSASLLKHFTRSGEYLASQLGVVSPVTCVLLLSLFISACFRLRYLDRRTLYLLCFTAPPLAGVAVLSLLQRVQPNWPAPFYAAGVLLVAAWGLGHIRLCPQIKTPGRHLNRAWATGAVAAAVTWSLPFVVPALGLQGTPVDPTIRLRGWQTLGSQIAKHLEAEDDQAPSLLIAADNRNVVSELAFYTSGQPRIYQWKGHPRVESQYDLWGSPADAIGQSALIVAPHAELPPSLANAFAQVQFLGEVEVQLGNGRRMRQRLWKGNSLREWPTEPRLAVPGSQKSWR